MSGKVKAAAISVALLLATMATVIGFRVLDSGDGAAPPQTPVIAVAGVWQNVLVPDHATDGVLTIVIPPGAADEMDAGNSSAIQLPSVMRLTIGDKIVIRNNDTRPHLVMYAYVLPGASNERVFNEPDLQVYSAGCSVTATSTGTFMTLMVAK